mmetsp:Transcript_20009/g.37776  ORF Transcript_20009/g.37776 Transcript_20009/m.37776 type:complete len:379 (+) Transcript_20009:61-1197(+)
MSAIHGAAAAPFVNAGANLQSAIIANTARVGGASSLTSKSSKAALVGTLTLSPAGAEFVAGAVAEFTKVSAIYPLDLIRNRLSCSSPGLYKNMVDCLRKTVEGEGVRGLYKGIVATWVSNVGKGTMGFGVYGSTLGYLNERAGVQKDAKDPWQNVVKASLVSAAASTFMECPLEIMAIQLQTQRTRAMESQIAAAMESSHLSCALQGFNASRRAHYATELRYGHKGLKDTAVSLWRHRSPFLGVGPLLLKNFLWFNGTFCTFDQTKALAARINYGEDSKAAQKKLGIGWKIICGASSGVVAWTCCFPFEVIKANMMGQPLERQYRSFQYASECAQTLYAEGGIPRLYRGLTPTIVRAIPAYTIVLNVYDLMRMQLGLV